MVRASGWVTSMRILSSRRTQIWPLSVDLSLTTTVTFVRSRSAVRLWKSAAFASSCLRTLSRVQLDCWETDATAVDDSKHADRIPQKNQKIRAAAVDNLINRASLIRLCLSM